MSEPPKSWLDNHRIHPLVGQASGSAASWRLMTRPFTGKYIAEAGITRKAAPHSLRHTFARRKACEYLPAATLPRPCIARDNAV